MRELRIKFGKPWDSVNLRSCSSKAAGLLRKKVNGTTVEKSGNSKHRYLRKTHFACSSKNGGLLSLKTAGKLEEMVAYLRSMNDLG